ncbi:hypothetical protein OIU76_029849 [Salix suchowensis]|nr:hypothetical protein OIU76_029849 [Salix suchowensis]
MQVGRLDNDYAFGSKQMENGNGNSELDGQASSASYSSNASTALVATEESAIGAGGGKASLPFDCISELPLFAMHILAVDGLIAAIQGMAERICNGSYTVGLDKNLVGDFLGNHDDFCVQILHELAWTFDFQDMNVDTALRLFLETVTLPGESHKLQRALEAFSERYKMYIVQVKKMTGEIWNNRHINGGNDLPQEFLMEVYHSICKNDIRTAPEQGCGYPEVKPKPLD